MDSATQDLQWILALLSASLLHAEEVAADDAGELRRSLDVVGSASAASAELPPLNSEVGLPGLETGAGSGPKWSDMLAVGWILHGFGEAVKEWARKTNISPPREVMSCNSRD